MNFVGHVFNVPIPKDFEHVENVLHEKITSSLRPKRSEKRTAVLSTGAEEANGE